MTAQLLFLAQKPEEHTIENHEGTEKEVTF